jgi:uncharacterized protein (DUF697 family)
VARFKDVANVWSTIKELDVRDIRDQAEQPCRIALVGQAGVERDLLARSLTQGALRFPPRNTAALDVLDIPMTRERGSDVSRADLVLLVLHGDTALSYDEVLAYEKVAVLPTPLLLVVIGGSSLPSASANVPAPDWVATPAVFLASLDDMLAVRKALAHAIVAALPETLHLPAARRLPGLRAEVAHSLITQVSLSNATFAFTSGIPEMIPVLNLPLNAADMLVLTKNQAILAYRIALAMGADGEFSAMIKELLPVIGGGFLWRPLARQLVGLIPGVGLLPKVAVSYAGTYATGIVAWRWYERGELISRAALQKILQEALVEGRERARALIPAKSPASAAAAAAPQRRSLRRRLVDRIRQLLPGKRQPAASPPESAETVKALPLDS